MLHAAEAPRLDGLAELGVRPRIGDDDLGVGLRGQRHARPEHPLVVLDQQVAAVRGCPAAGTAVSTSVTYASIVVWPVAMAIDTRWWPSLTKCRSPTRYTSIGGIDSPRRWASASRSHRSRTRLEVGRKRRSKSRVRVDGADDGVELDRLQAERSARPA